jgi:hypothetical protein
MSKTVKELYEFIDRAEKSRKYPPATAQSLKAALRLFEAELNEDERNSVDLFKKNLEQIYHLVTVKNGKTMSSNSLVTYKSRVNKVLNHFEKYGVDPTKMVNWNPTVITRKSKKKTAASIDTEEKSSSSAGIGSNDNFIFDFVGNVKLVIPKTPTTNEAIMDGELKEIKSGLKAFAEKFCNNANEEDGDET